MRAHLTKRTVDALRPGPADLFAWDTEPRGFGLKLTPAGKRVYLVQYRVGPRSRRYTIGPHGSPWTPQTARTEAARLLGERAQGHDPAARKRAWAHAPSLHEVAARFVAEHVRTKRRPRTAAEYERLLAGYILPELGARLVRDVNAEDIARLHHRHRATPYQANRLVALCRTLFNWIEAKGLRPDASNPCRHLDAFPEARRRRYLAPEEWTRLGEALEAARVSGQYSLYALSAIVLLALTGARKGEVLALRWTEVDPAGRRLHLAMSKTGPKTIYLGEAAAALLEALPRLEGSPWVFPGHVRGAPLVNIDTTWQAIRHEAKLDDVRLHDLRHNAGSRIMPGGFRRVDVFSA